MTESLWAVAAVVGGSGLTVATVLALFVKAGLGVLGKSHEQRMEQGHKERLADINHAHDERMADLQLGHQRELERFKTDLAVAAHEAQARSSALVAKQGEAVAELYERVVWAEQKLRELVDPSGSWSQGSANTARSALDSVRDHLATRRLYLRETTCALLDETCDQFDSIREMFDGPIIDDRLQKTGQNAWEARKDAFARMQETVPQAKRALEDQFRQLLGVETEGARHGS